MRKPSFCTCENPGTDQLRGDRKAYQRFCLRYKERTTPFLHKSESSSFKLYSAVCVGPGRNSEYRFSDDATDDVKKQGVLQQFLTNEPRHEKTNVLVSD